MQTQNWHALTGVDATAEFSLLQLAALASHAEFAVTNDSGPMHLLACGSIPVYGLFGPSDWRRNHAVDQVDHVISLNRNEPAFRATRLEEPDSGPCPAAVGTGRRLVTGSIDMC